MQKNPREQIGSFTVVNQKNELQQVIISQEILSFYSSDHKHSKTLNLDSPEGQPVYKTKDPDILKLRDGTILKRASHLPR